MALGRCLTSHAWPKGKKTDYIGYVQPVGYPDSALICGIPECNRPAVIWLDVNEEESYKEGNRIFRGPSHFTKMKANDKGVFK